VKPPDVLVLGAGGTLREAWLSGFLAGAGQQGGTGFRQSAHFAGTSAGSIVTARLALGPRGTPHCGMSGHSGTGRS
jgi:hypothetical protein